MFRENHLILFLLCILPVVFYSLVIFANSPSFSIRLKTSFTYLYTGLLSITLLQFIFFIFPHVQDKLFENFEGAFNFQGKRFEIFQPTLNTLLIYAFAQVALMEEFSKWAAFKCANYMRGKRRNRIDHPYAIMFYSALISAAFSIVENIQYAQRGIVGEFGLITPSNIIIGRGITSVVIHMVCGLFMGYYIALAKNSNLIKKILYNIIGISAATFIHGVYDFNCLNHSHNERLYKIIGSFKIDTFTIFILFFCFIISYFMSIHLKHINQKEIRPQ